MKIKIKDYEIYLGFYVNLWRWILLLEIDLESFSKDYTEINLGILCFYFTFAGLSKKFGDKLDRMTEGIDNG